MNNLFLPYLIGGTLSSSLKTLHDEGGISRLYQGLPFALIQVRRVSYSSCAIISLLIFLFLPSLLGTTYAIWGYGSKRWCVGAARKYTRNSVFAPSTEVRRNENSMCIILSQCYSSVLVHSFQNCNGKCLRRYMANLPHAH